MKQAIVGADHGKSGMNHHSHVQDSHDTHVSPTPPIRSFSVDPITGLQKSATPGRSRNEHPTEQKERSDFGPHRSRLLPLSTVHAQYPATLFFLVPPHPPQMYRIEDIAVRPIVVTSRFETDCGNMETKIVEGDPALPVVPPSTSDRASALP